MIHTDGKKWKVSLIRNLKKLTRRLFNKVWKLTDEYKNELWKTGEHQKNIVYKSEYNDNIREAFLRTSRKKTMKSKLIKAVKEIKLGKLYAVTTHEWKLTARECNMTNWIWKCGYTRKSTEELLKRYQGYSHYPITLVVLEDAVPFAYDTETHDWLKTMAEYNLQKLNKDNNYGLVVSSKEKFVLHLDVIKTQAKAAIDRAKSRRNSTL